MGNEKLKTDFCDYHKEHFSDNHVFSYLRGDALVCDRYYCPNNGGEKMKVDGVNFVGICKTFGLVKSIEDSSCKIIEDKIIKDIVKRDINEMFSKKSSSD